MLKYFNFYIGCLICSQKEIGSSKRNGCSLVSVWPNVTLSFHVCLYPECECCLSWFRNTCTDYATDLLAFSIQLLQ